MFKVWHTQSRRPESLSRTKTRFLPSPWVFPFPTMPSSSISTPLLLLTSLSRVLLLVCLMKKPANSPALSPTPFLWFQTPLELNPRKMLHLRPILVVHVRTLFATFVTRKDTTRQSAGRNRSGRTRRPLLRHTLRMILMSGNFVIEFLPHYGGVFPFILIVFSVQACGGVLEIQAWHHVVCYLSMCSVACYHASTRFYLTF
ncbi:hypothetical protein C8R44DRAFT_659584 [Mycena epipterygia]|nr:hypothetical protein C8R44DRAFT_659584 [Mycena epipterygia]